MSGKSKRYVEPRILKFWNLPKKEENGKSKVRRSQNVHFYHNTVRTKYEAINIGGNTKIDFSPYKSAFRNNIFYSETSLTSSLGYEDHGIVFLDNIFYSGLKSNRNFLHEFIASNNSWNGNLYIKLRLKSRKKTQSWSSATKKRIGKSIPGKLPKELPKSGNLNLGRIGSSLK